MGCGKGNFSSSPKWSSRNSKSVFASIRLSLGADESRLAFGIIGIKFSSPATMTQ